MAEAADLAFARSAEARRAAMLREVGEGLARTPKELPPKFFYDQRGSELFEAITELPEYYLTRTERKLLRQWMPVWLRELAPRSLVELGAGSAAKTRTVLDAMGADTTPTIYVPVDVSADFLAATAEALRAEYPVLEVRPLIADISAEFSLRGELPTPRLFAFLGSTIGNFAPPAALRLLRGVRAAMEPGDRFLLGVDLRKDQVVLEAAYNDARGLTAEFNRNMLRVVNRELGADFDEEGFDHLAFYDDVEHRIEMHLVSRRAQRVRVPGAGVFEFAAGERLRTEISCKYDRATIDVLFARAGLDVERWQADPAGRYAILLGAGS